MQENKPEQQQQQQQPKRRRYRIPRSCDRCRSSKIKCVFQDGQCTACVNARVPCTFANPGSLKERPPTQKDVEHLQARIRSLERLIHAIDPAFDLSALPDPSESHHLDSNSARHRLSTSSFVLSPSDKPFQLFLDTHDSQTSDPTLSSLFFPSLLKLNPSASSVPFSLVNVDGLSPVDQIIHQEYRKKNFWNYSFYPEPDLEQSLMQLYFKNVHPCLPILHPATFIQDLQSGLARTSESFRALCLVMMSVSSRFSNDPRVFLDMDGNPQHSLHAPGMRYAIIAASYLFQPVTTPSNIHELQAILLMVVRALGTVSPDAAWDVVGFGLQKAQEVGTHLEKSPNWSNCPIQDHLRRKVFIILYEFDCFLSTAVGKPAYMQESDFDVLPPDLDFETAIGTYANPFPSSTTKQEEEEHSKLTNDLGLAYWSLKSSFGGLKNLFPLMDVMNARKDSYPGAKFSSCIEILINQLDSSMTKCYDKIAQKFSTHQSSNANVTDCQLISSVNAVTWYHEFRLLTHKVLFGCKPVKSNTHEEHGSTSTNNNPVISKTTTNSHAEICIESARMILSLINRLHQRNLLELGFYWIPLRLTNALIVLIVSLKKFRKTLSVEQRNLRCYEISLGIQILNVLAPSTFLAEKFARMMIQFYECVQQQQEQQHQHNSKKLSSSSSPPPMLHSSTSTSSPNESSSPQSEDNKEPNIVKRSESFTLSSSTSSSSTNSTSNNLPSQPASASLIKHNNDISQQNKLFDNFSPFDFFPSNGIDHPSRLIDPFELDFNLNPLTFTTSAPSTTSLLPSLSSAPSAPSTTTNTTPTNSNNAHPLQFF